MMLAFTFDPAERLGPGTTPGESLTERKHDMGNQPPMHRAIASADRSCTPVDAAR